MGDRDDGSERLEHSVSELNRLIGVLLDRLEKFNLAQYLAMYDHPGRLFWFNFFAGVARGLGAAVGFTLVTGLLLYLLQRIVMLHLPIISDVLVHLINMIRQRGGF